MTWLRSLSLAFSMYSKIPMPKTLWQGKHTNYVLCFFPVVGLVVGLAEVLWYHMSNWMGLGVFFYAGVAAVIPVFITGGIHVDGFCDTADALGSHQSRERKLEILKDSHIGAFALIATVVYFMLTFATWGELSQHYYLSLGQLLLIFPLTRTLSALLAVTMPNARGEGLLACFTEGRQLVGVRGVIIGLLVTICLLLIVVGPPAVAGLMLVVAGTVVWGFVVMANKQFGGITGDLAGWFLQVCELALLIALVFGERMV